MFSTNSYYEDSIKGQDRTQTGIGGQLILDGLVIRIPNDFKLLEIYIVCCQMIEIRNN